MRKMTLKEMSNYLLDIRGSGFMDHPSQKGERKKVTSAYVELTQVDFAKLSQIADVLDYFDLDRENKRLRGR